MRLRTHAALLLAVANAAVFGVLALFVLGEVRHREERDREQVVAATNDLALSLAPLLEEALRFSAPGSSGFDLERVLAWPFWDRIGDAVVMDARTARIGETGPILPLGLFVNPVGISQRSPEFDVARVKTQIDAAMGSGGTVADVDGQGIAIPVRSEEGVIGGVYLAVRPPRAASLWTVSFLALAFLVSTVTLTAMASFLVTSSVVRPVEQLARLARRIASGDLEAEPRPLRSDDEMEHLGASMAAMLATLRSHREELERACAVAADRAKRAERDLLVTQRLASLGTLAAGIAHEINNPLGGLTNAVRRLREGGLPPDREKEYLDLVLDGLERIRGIVGRVLSMGPRAIPPLEVQVGDVVREALAFAEHRARSAGVSVSLEGEGSSAARVRGDRGELVQVVLNLLLNAIDAVGGRSDPKAGGSVRIGIARDGGEVVVRVRDDGPGIDPVILDRVLDPFFTTKEPGRGTGLGLTVAYAVVESHGGRLELRNHPDGGLEATVRLPLAREGEPPSG